MLVDDVGLPDRMAGQETGELACSPVVVTPDDYA
jgi:hypothetical protein